MYICIWNVCVKCVLVYAIHCILCIYAYTLCLLDIPRQLTCMKLQVLGNCISLYNPAMSFADIQQICCSTQTGQHSPLLRGSCCPVWALQRMYIHCLHVCIYIVYVRVCHGSCCQGFCIVEVVNGHLGT